MIGHTIAIHNGKEHEKLTECTTLMHNFKFGYYIETNLKVGTIELETCSFFYLSPKHSF